MALSSNSKKGLAIGALLPVLLSAYTESRKQAESQAQRSAAHYEERQKHLEAEQARDLDSAQKFLSQVIGDATDPDDKLHDGSFCDHVYIASELVRLSSYSTAMQAAVTGTLQYRSEHPGVASDDAASARPRICGCPVTLEQMRISWRPGKRSTLATPAVIDEMTTALEAVASKCSTDDTATASPPPRLPVAAALPPPPRAAPPPTSARPMAGHAGPAPMAAPPPVSAMPMMEGCTAPPAQPLGSDVQVRVYLQIAGEAQRADAQVLQATLRRYGYVVPGIERVGAASAPNHAQLRYIYDEDRADAQRLLANANGASQICSLAATAFELAPPMTQYRGRSLRHSFEIWFPK